jgi:hypothetical protein
VYNPEGVEFWERIKEEFGKIVQNMRAALEKDPDALQKIKRFAITRSRARSCGALHADAAQAKAGRSPLMSDEGSCVPKAKAGRSPLMSDEG